MKKQYIVLFVILLLCSCVSLPNQTERTLSALHLAQQHGWVKKSIDTDKFTLQAFLPLNPRTVETLTIYIEGDGLAWITSSIASTNPTPIQPLALKLALLDTHAAAYLARPCQYITENVSKNCLQQHWTSHRFSPEVIQASNQAIDHIKQQFGATNLILVGYSGGGAVAALVAAMRHDVLKLVTVAGNLDHVLWTQKHQLSPLRGSLNPAEAWMDLQAIAQRHYVGDKDTNIGKDIAQAYANRFVANKAPNITVIENFDHHCCWESIWQDLVSSQFGDLPTLQKIRKSHQ